MSEHEQSPLRIVVGSDDAGIDYKEKLAEQLASDRRVAEVIDVGVSRGEHTDYPLVATEAARRVADGSVDRGLLVCGTGLGMAITANKTPGVRAVTAHDIYSVERSVLSNNAQVLTMGQRVIGLELARRLVDRWLGLRFDDASPSAAKVALIEAGSDPIGLQKDPGSACADPDRPVCRTAIVGSSSGLHARPAKLFSERARDCGHEVWVSKGNGRPVMAASILAVMTLGANRGDAIEISVRGPRAEEVADGLAALAASNLDEV
jgi:ribose 5-phosphate isomerase B